jgi:hypothetical protein
VYQQHNIGAYTTNLLTTELVEITTRPKHTMPVFELELMETTMDRVRAVRATTSSPPEPESLPKRLCGTTALAGVTVQDAATLLALAQCTGWTADRIAREFNEKKGLKLTAEEVWDIHKSWMAMIKKEKRALELLDVAVMKTLLNKFGIIKIPYDTPLNETNRPVCCSLNNLKSPRLANKE